MPMNRRRIDLGESANVVEFGNGLTQRTLGSADTVNGGTGDEPYYLAPKKSKSLGHGGSLTLPAIAYGQE